MAEMEYVDFDLVIERVSKKAYRTRVLSSPAGQATGELRLPFNDLELENFLLKIGRTRRGVRRLESPEMEAAKQFGGKLFKSVFSAELMSCLRSSIDDANQKGQGLRIRLRLNDAPELVNLPWEYLYNPALNRFLTLSVNTPLVRYLELPERISPLGVSLPLKILAVISSPADFPPLDVEREWSNLQTALKGLQDKGLVVLDRLEAASPVELQYRLRRQEYHILHFIGHGGFNEQAQDGILLFEDEGKRGRPLSGQYLGTLLHDEKTLRLVVLNACEGGRSGSSDPFAGVAQSLVQQGVPAVIAMQFEVTDEAAITFAREFYTAVAEGYPADAAVAEARKAIFSLGNDIEWGTPVLYMRSPDGQVFDISRARRSAVEETGPHRAASQEQLPVSRGVEPPVSPVTETPSQADRQAQLYTQARKLHQEQRWQAVVNVIAQMRTIDAAASDPDGLLASAESHLQPVITQPQPVLPVTGGAGGGRPGGRNQGSTIPGAQPAPAPGSTLSVPRWAIFGVVGVLLFAAVAVGILLGMRGGGQQNPPPTADLVATANAAASATLQALALLEPTETLTATPPPSPTATQPAPTLLVVAATPTAAPTLPPQDTATPSVPPGIPYVRINSITIDQQDRYVVEYETFLYTEKLPGVHVHFFFNTVPPEQAGSPGSGPWYLYGGPRPFTGYKVSNRPPGAMQMCALVANANHSIQMNSGNCVDLP